MPPERSVNVNNRRHIASTETPTVTGGEASSENEHWHVARPHDSHPTLDRSAGGQANTFQTQADAERIARKEETAHSPVRCLMDHTATGPNPHPPERYGLTRHMLAHLDGNSSHEEAVRRLNEATNGKWSHRSELIRRNRGRGFIRFMLTGEEDENDLLKATVTAPVREGTIRSEGTAEIHGSYREAEEEALRKAIIKLRS